MGLHSSVGTAQSAALTQRPWVRIPLKSQHFFLEQDATERTLRHRGCGTN